MIVLRFNGALSAEAMARIREQLDDAVKNDRIIVVDSSVEVFTDESDLIRLEAP